MWQQLFVVWLLYYTTADHSSATTVVRPCGLEQGCPISKQLEVTCPTGCIREVAGMPPVLHHGSAQSLPPHCCIAQPQTHPAGHNLDSPGIADGPLAGSPGDLCSTSGCALLLAKSRLASDYTLSCLVCELFG